MRLPAAPLLALFPGWSAQAIASELGVTRRTIERWKAGGNVALRDADRVAVASGWTPYGLWPEYTEAAVASVQKRCARCDRLFLPGRAFQKYCRPACRVATDIEKRPKSKPRLRRCAHCGGWFTSIRSNHIRCSQTCNRAARYKSNADQEREYQRAYNAALRSRRQVAA